MDFWPKMYLILYPSCGNATTHTTILNVPTEIRPHAGDVEFWLIPLSNVKATIAATLLDLEFYVSASTQCSKCYEISDMEFFIKIYNQIVMLIIDIDHF